MDEILKQIRNMIGADKAADFDALIKDKKLLDNSNGDYVSKGKYDGDIGRLTMKLSETENTNKELSEAIKNSGTSAEELKAAQEKITSIESDYKAKIETMQKEHSESIKKSYIKNKLIESGCIDPESALYKINNLNDLVFENENVDGLADVIKNVQENAAHLFNITQPKTTTTPGVPSDGKESIGADVMAIFNDKG